MIPEDELQEDLKNLPLDEVLSKYELSLSELFKLQRNKQYHNYETNHINENKSGTYSINKTVNGTNYYYGSYRDKREAQLIANQLEQCGWDINELPRILEELNITSKTEKVKKDG